jgi:hypothetical protein
MIQVEGHERVFLDHSTDLILADDGGAVSLVASGEVRAPQTAVISYRKNKKEPK